MNREDLDEQLKENGLTPKHKESSFRVGQKKLALLAAVPVSYTHLGIPV